jgi:hypothetical protein
MIDLILKPRVTTCIGTRLALKDDRPLQPTLPAMETPHRRFPLLRLAVAFSMTLLSACGTWIHDDIPMVILAGPFRWIGRRKISLFYRPGKDPLWFKPSFLKGRITPVEMYTDGGSVPRVFWNIPGLSPWALGPAYVIHDYIFLVHRCGLPDPEVAKLTFEDSALVLAEVGKSL